MIGRHAGRTVGGEMLEDALRRRGIDAADSIRTARDFGRELTVLRRQAGMSLRELTRAIGVPLSTLGGYFAGRHLPYVGQSHVLEKILLACSVRDADVIARWMAAYDRARDAHVR